MSIWLRDFTRNSETKVEQFNFPAGEVGIRIPESFDPTGYEIGVIARIQKSDDLVALLLVADALKRGFPHLKDSVMLFLGYVPYARQDRVMTQGESLSISVVANLINSCGFKNVRIVDPHSDITPALLDNCWVNDQLGVFHPVTNNYNLSEFTIIAPDAGAVKKAEKFAEFVGAKRVVVALKQRDLSTGKIKKLQLTEDVTGDKVLVLDDILDAGGTFLMLSEYLKETEIKILCVTHGIFSKGYEDILNAYDHVYTTNTYRDHEDYDKLTVYNVLGI